ncbi:MAG: NADH:ubiquinone reductase (Na(+)-transporting) subunit C [Firmicutes bacterium]|nr:NADH:ubiquinone reductase (Na(+)-transporting) subunit C [Bacillota bacterium]MCM1402032.1 NADH:ubiquinone reductase (Na(+)-transporting) subunit C [Bacteroides sp.]MCM1476603.1 NADH:ubiquinone reductase (Na(+)-transporting) subunit C [Bacteroides sp.]
MNKQSNVYTTIYIVVLVLVVGTALAATSLALKPLQQQNADADKMRQILAAVHIVPDKDQITADFSRYITRQEVINSQGEEVTGNAFEIDMAKQVKLPDAERQLPVFICTLPDGSTKYILPAYGAGLWGPIWGYIAIDANGSTIYGAYFAHQGETPGLGAEIEKPAFTDQFNSSLNLFKNGQFLPIGVVKGGVAPANGADYVNGISGGTITSKGVGSMLDNCLTPYKTYLEKLSK